MSCILDTPANRKIASGLNMSLESYRALVSTLSVKDPDLENRIENLSEEEVVLALQQKLQNEIRYTTDKDIYDIINTLYDTYKDGDITDVIGSDIENLLSPIKNSLFYYVASDGKNKIHLFKTEFIDTKPKNDEQSQLKRDTKLFLSNFGLTLNDLDSYNGDVPLFDALNRVVNAKTDTDITEGVGYAIAFMMQHDPTFRDAIAFSKSNSQGVKGISRNLKRVLLTGNNSKRQLGTEENLQFIGSEIAKELRKLYNIDTDNITGEKDEKESLFKKIWSIIDRFFQLLSDSQLRTRLTNAALYTKNAAKAVKNNDKSFIVKDNIKPGSDKEGTALDIQQAIKDNPYEASIVELMTKHGIALGGSASIASKGTIYRYADNPLHDLDFNAKGKTEEEIESILKQNFKFYIKTNVIEDNDPDDPERRTLTYLVIDREVKEEQISGTKAVNIIDVKTGEVIGRREYSDLFLKDGVQGKMLDFFMGDPKNNFTDTTNVTINGKDYLFADPRNAFLFKINVAREKDIFDYNRYVPYAEETLDENKNVKYNKNTSIELLNFLKNHLFAVNFKSPNGDKRVLRSLVHSFKNKFNEAWLTKLTRHDDIIDDEVYDQQLAKRLVSNYLRQIGLDDAIVLIDTPNATKVRIYENRLIDAIEEHNTIEDIGTPIPDSKWEQSLLGFLSKRLGVEFKHITVAEAKALLGDKYNSKINAFNLNSTAYFIKGKKINADIKSEEMLHPFIASMHKYNPEVFNDLLKDAKQNFKKLYLGILNTYDESEADEELVTQALARVFVEEKQKNKKPFVTKMIAKFKQWLVSMFSSEPTLKLGDVTLKDIAQLINSDAELIYKKVENLSFNKNYIQTNLFETTNINLEQNTYSNKSSDSAYKVETYTGTWTRKSVENQQDKVFLFGDNTDDRINTKYIPATTQAVIRGLPNAIGIDTKKSRSLFSDAYFTDDDFEEFKKGVDEAINKAKQSGKPIVIPVDENGNPNIGTGKASLQTRAPKCFNYLQSELNKLLGRDVQSTPAEVSINTSQIVTKIISGGQTGVDTIGLQVAKELGIETGGTAPKGFVREQGIDDEDIRNYGLIEITDEQQSDYTKRTGKKDAYTGRTELNVRNSDGTVYFSTDADRAGKIATQRAANEWGKPFLENPTAEQLRQWIIDNNIKTLNVAGSRGSALENGENIVNLLKEALRLEQTQTYDPLIITNTNNTQTIATSDGEIQFTQEQQEAINTVVSFVEDRYNGEGDDKVPFITIQGMAGTGKTTIVSAIAKELKKRGIHNSIGIAAVSRKAVGVLKKKLLKAGVAVAGEESIYSLLGASPMQSEDKYQLDERNNKLKDYNLIFIDEASMIGQNSYDQIYKYINDNPDTTVVFLGDYGQLKPIAKQNEESKKSPVFLSDTSKKVTLTERIRQGEGSPILDYADKFYVVSIGNSDEHVTKLIPAKTVVTDKGALVMLNKHNPSTNEQLIELFKEGMDLNDIDHVTIIVGTNKARIQYCEMIHDALFPANKYEQYKIASFIKEDGKHTLYGSTNMSVGDIITFYAPYKLNNMMSFDNSENIKIKNISEIKTKKTAIGDIKYRTITVDKTIPVVGKMECEIPVLDTSDVNNVQRFEQIKQALLETAKSINKITNPKAYREAWKRYYEIESLFAKISLGYAITTHKAQGSTYDVGVIDINDITSVQGWENQDHAENIYTALTRARNVSVVLTNNNGGVEISSVAKVNSNIEEGKTGKTTKDIRKEVKEEKEKEEKPESFDQNVDSTLNIKDGVITIAPNSTKEQLNESIKHFANDYRNPLYQTLNIDVTSCETVEDLIQLIQTLNKQKGRLIYSYYDGEETFKTLPKEWQEKLKENNITYIPVYTFGGTYNEIQIREQTNNIINAENKGELLFHSSELRDWGRSAFAQFHYNLELLKQMSEANEQFFGDKFKNENFLNNTTEEILNKIGVANALEYLLKEPVFNVNKNTVSLSSRLLSKKMSVIYNNFKGFVNMNYDHLLLFDNIELTDISSKSHIDTIQETQADIEDVEKKDEIDIAEEYGSSQEHWQIGFRSVSPHNSLSQKIRDRLNMLLDLDENGIAQKNELGLNKLIDIHEAVNQILLFTQDSESLDNKKEDGTYETTSMVYKLQQHISEHKWLEQLVGKHYVGGNDTLDEIDGILVNNDNVNEQFKSLFYNNFQKHFQKYNILYNDGQNTILKTINLSDFTSDTLIDIKNRFEDKENGKLSMFDTTSNSFKLNAAQTFSQKLREISSKLATQSDTLNDNDLNLLFNAYINLDISVPPFDIFSRTINALNKTTLQKTINAASYIFDNIYTNAQNNPNYEYLNSSNKSNFKQLTEAIALSMASDMESVFHQDGKSYYSYVQPAYLNKLINKLSGKTENYEKFIQDEYKQYSGWFTFINKKGETVWLNDWLQKLATEKKARGILNHAVLLSDNGVGYIDKTPAQYFSSILSNYFYSSSAKDTAWFRVGILSNKPSEEYIKFYKYSGVGFEDVICEKLFRQTFSQEVFRIKAIRERKKVAKEYEKLQKSLNDKNLTEEERTNIEQQIKNLNYSKENEIANFDKNGDKFFFLEFLNDEIKNNTELGNAVSRVINENTEIKDIEYNGLTYHSDLEFLKTELPKAIRNYLEEHYESFKQEQANNGAFELNEDGTYKSSDDKNIRSVLKNKGEEGLKEFYFNDFFAQVNITQLTITDLSFYKNTEDLQKRLAQLHAPSIKPNINATFNGEKVSDGKFRTVYIKDSIVESDIIPNLMASAEVILNNDRLKDNPLLKSQVKARLDNIIKQFKEINWADAQGYTSPTAYRKRMIMYGKWSERDQKAYEQVLSGNVDVESLDILWQPLKPFGYSQIGVNGHNKYMPKIKMGIQNKNSEYLLIMADAIMRGANINNKLSAIYDVMEDSYKRGNKSKGIDAIQFESTVKVGKRSVIDINNINNSDEIKKVFNDKLYLNGTYNTEYVQEYDFEDYGIQQEVPSHFEGSQQQGSQVRILAVSDIPAYTLDGKENHVTVNGKQESVSEARKKYFEAIDRNIQRSIDDIKKQFHLDDINPKLRNKTISDMLRNEILKDNRYGNDLLWACSLDENGDFNVPLSDPIHSNRIQQLLNSIVKNRVWKQKIAGGPVVQVSSYGLSEDLHIRFNDKNGNLLKTYDEFIKENPNDDYNKYVKENSNSLAYLECYVPIYDESLLSDFMKDDGTIDVEAMEKNNPDLLNMFGYRIPTESKYSMVPIKIKGFLPRNAGEGIMLPKEITLLSGSDFDIDKLYVMRYEFLRQETYPTNKLKAYRDTIKETTGKDYNLNQIADHLHGKSIIEDKNVSSLLAKIAKPKYNYIKQKNGRGGDNNTILDYSIAFVTSQVAFEQFFTPGNFDEPKRIGYLIQACKNTGEDYKELSKLSIDELKDKAYQKQSLLFVDTQIKFHRQNMVAGKLIGAFAQANVSHGFVSTWHDMNPKSQVGVNVPPMIINGKSYDGLTPIDNEYENSRINRVSNNLSSYLAASVDAVKDPILNLMNINMDTVNIAITLIRLGESIETVGLLLSHPAIINAVNNGDLKNNGQGLFDTISELEKSTRVSDNIDISNEWLAQQLTRPSDTANQITQNKHSDLLVLKAIQNLISVANTVRSITTATRLNSISSAVGPFISDTVIQQIDFQEFRDTSDETITPTITQMLDSTPIISTIYKGVHQDIVPKLFDDVMLTDLGTLAKLFKEIENRLGYCSKNIARKFTDFLSSYIQCLDGTSVFDMSDENRDYILNKFPQEFKDAKTKYPDNKLIQAIKIVFDNNNNQMLEIKTRGYSSDQIEDLKKAWEELWNVDKNLAEKLVEYNFFKGSFTFNPRTFMQLVPNNIKLKLNNYIDNQLYFNPDNFDVSTCIDQFMVMNGLAERYFKDENSFNAFVREYSAPTNNSELKDIFRHIIVRFGDNLMYVSPIIQGGFTQIDNLGCGNKIFEIDPSRAVYEIRTVMSNKSSENDGETSKLQSDEITQPLSTNDAEILQKITVKDLIGEDVYDTFGNNTAELIKSVKIQFNNLGFFKNELKQRTGLTENALQTIKRKLDKISTNEPITLEQLNKTINEINPC